jgi:hypothetical protein
MSGAFLFWYLLAATRCVRTDLKTWKIQPFDSAWAPQYRMDLGIHGSGARMLPLAFGCGDDEGGFRFRIILPG